MFRNRPVTSQTCVKTKKTLMSADDKNATLPWVEKYRPQTMAEVKGHSDIITVLGKYGGIARTPHLLFYGPPGSGKTSTILAMANEYYGSKNIRDMVMEVNASDERGVEVVTGKIKSFVETRSFSGRRVKLVILDEADALTVDAQSALRRIMEKSTSGARFCLCCNYINNLSGPIQSRCTRFHFKGIDRESLRSMAFGICSKERVVFEEGAIDALLDLSKGDARRVINLMQSASLGCPSDSCSIEYIYRLTGSPLPGDIDTVFSALVEKSFQDSFERITTLVNDKGYAVTDVVSDLVSRVVKYFAADPDRLSFLLDEFSNIEYNLSAGGSQRLAVGHRVSAFHMRLLTRR